MHLSDVLMQSWRALVAHRLRSLLTILGIVIGIASVILLTSLGEGTRQYILAEFTQFGSNILAINLIVTKSAPAIEHIDACTDLGVEEASGRGETLGAFLNALLRKFDDVIHAGQAY